MDYDLKAKYEAMTNEQLFEETRSFLMAELLGERTGKLKKRLLEAECTKRDGDFFSNILVESVAASEIIKANHEKLVGNGQKNAEIITDEELKTITKPIIDELRRHQNDEKKSALFSKMLSYGDNRYFLSMVDGDSMVGADLFDNDSLIVDKFEVPQSGSIVVVLIHGRRYVKRYVVDEDGRTIFRSENPDYADFVMDEGKDFRILGVVKMKMSDV